MFAIDSKTGSITVKTTPDREENEFYSLTIQASDKAKVTERLSSTAQVWIIYMQNQGII